MTSWSRGLFIPVILLLLIAFFQNCEVVSLNSFSSGGSSNSDQLNSSISVGNGGGYDGKIGNSFYHFVPSFQCLNQKAQFYSKIIVEGQTTSFIDQSSCEKQASEISTKDLQLSLYDSTLVGYRNELFLYSSSETAPDQNTYVEIWCFDQSDLQREVVFKYNSQTKISSGVLYQKGTPRALRDEVARYWETFGVAAGKAGVKPPAGAVLEQMLQVWACSEFVARACIREPAALAELLAGGDLAATRAPGEHAARLDRLLADAADENRLGVALRRFRRWEMVRIAWRDLAGLAGSEATLGDLSDLAERLVDAALERLHVWQCQRYGQPRDPDGQPQRLVVLGMGKLGGRELNFCISGGIFEVLSTNGDTYLGGDDFDRVIVKHWADQLRITSEELGIHKRLAQELRLVAEEAKKHLSLNDTFSGKVGVARLACQEMNLSH